MEPTAKIKSPTNEQLQKQVQQLQAQLEQKDHYLKIEASLDRLRSVAMEMRRSEELLSICEVLYTELTLLGFTGLRRSMINIDDDATGSFINYDYSPDFGTSTTRFLYNSHAAVNFLNRIRKTKDAFAETVLNGSELENFRQFRMEHGEVDDPTLDNISALYYYFYSICTGAIGVSAYSSISEEKRDLLKRFRNVFDFAYRRYLDIAQAEAQAREAKIEASLERVRARAMAMHSSEDLSATVNVFFKELKELGVVPIRCGVGQVEDETRSTHLTVTTASQQGESFQVVGKLKQAGHPVLEAIYDNWKLQKDYFPVLRGDEIRAYYAVTKNQIAFPEYDENVTQYGNMFYFKEGFAFAWTAKELSEDEMKVFRRFTSVLSLTYKRYADLKEAEAQTREAKIEAALERVRSRTMAMQRSEELPETVHVLFQQFMELGEAPNQMNIGIANEEEGVFEISGTDPNSVGSKFEHIVKMPFTEPMLMKPMHEAWKAQKKSISFDLHGQALIDYIHFRSKIRNVPVVSEQMQGHRIINAAFFSKGSISISTLEPRPASTIALLERFAGVFDLTYTRFLDLKQAEAQAREAKIEAALELVRARTMAMQHSDELGETTHLLFQQFKVLGETPDQMNITIYNEEEGVAEAWGTDPNSVGHQLNKMVKMRLDNPDIFQVVHDAWKAQKKSIVIDLSGKELSDYIHLRSAARNVPVNEDQLKGHRCFYIAFFSKGTVGFSTLEPRPEATISLVERFAGVFDLTYTRFLDLKQAEAQANEAKIEAALERVRARISAMQKSDELVEISKVLFEQFKVLGVTARQFSIGIIDEEKGTVEVSATLQGNPLPQTFTDSVATNIVLKGFVDAWKAGKKAALIELTPEQLHDYNIYRSQRTGVQFNVTELYANNSWFVHCSFFSQGLLAFSAGERLPDEYIRLLERFTSVFELAYTRFLDLKKAEARAIEADRERKRSESLLLNILPEEIANELKLKGSAEAKLFENVTVLFTDFKNFTIHSERMSPQELVNELHECFKGFDEIVGSYGIEKIKTVGDAYLAVSGLPQADPEHAINMVKAALEIRDFMLARRTETQHSGLTTFEVRIGVHSGQVVAGIVGVKKFAYDIWGDTVNTAARMEQNGEAGKVNVSDNTFNLIKDKFTCTPRGKIAAKNKGEVDMYFVERALM